MKNAWLAGLLFATSCTGSEGDPVEYPPPVVRDDVVSIPEDGELALSAIAANDENAHYIDMADFEELPQHGRLVSAYSYQPTVEAWKYVPAPGYHGPDRFVYRGRNYVNDVSADAATVTIDVTSDGISYEQSRQLSSSPGSGIGAGDIDGDGRPDAVVAEYSGGTVQLLINATAAPGQYAVTTARFEGGRDPYEVEVSDLDGDGKQDIVVAAGDDGVVILRNRGVSPLEFDAPVYFANGEITDLLITDIDRDGKQDVAAVSYSTSKLVVQLNTSTPGNVSFGPSYEFTTPSTPSQIVAGDADGVGGPDFIVLSPGASTFSLFVNAMAVGDTVPAFAARIDRATGNYPTGVVMQDLDSDGRPEIAVLGDDQIWVYANRTVGSGTPDFIAARVLDLAFDASFIAAFDLDGVGPKDLVLGGRFGDFAFLMNTSTPAGFAFDTRDLKIGDAGTNQRASLGTTYGMTTANLDATGVTELLVTGSSGTFVLFE